MKLNPLLQKSVRENTRFRGTYLHPTRLPGLGYLAATVASTPTHPPLGPGLLHQFPTQVDQQLHVCFQCLATQQVLGLLNTRIFKNGFTLKH